MIWYNGFTTKQHIKHRDLSLCRILTPYSTNSLNLYQKQASINSLQNIMKAKHLENFRAGISSSACSVHKLRGALACVILLRTFLLTTINSIMLALNQYQKAASLASMKSSRRNSIKIYLPSYSHAVSPSRASINSSSKIRCIPWMHPPLNCAYPYFHGLNSDRPKALLNCM